MEKNQMGKCPYCGSYAIKYEEEERIDDHLIRHYCKCADCKEDFFEYEVTIYKGYSILDNKKQWHHYDENGDEI